MSPARSTLSRAVPAAGWLPRWRSLLRRDTLAALAVWALLVPQSMAYASIAGVPPVNGLYAALAGLLLYALLGTSAKLNVGPSSGVALLSASTVAPLAADNAGDYLALSAGLALISGAILVIGGLLKLGFIAEFLARPLLIGYSIGLALTIVLGQLPALLGIPAGSGSDFFTRAANTIRSLESIEGWTAFMGLGTLVVLLALQRATPRFPAALLAVVAGVGLSRLLDLATHGVALLGSMTSSLPDVGLPELPKGGFGLLLGGAAGIAVLSYAESIATARMFTAKGGAEIDANRELVALGGANLGAGLVQGFPINGSTSRSVAADAAGQRSQLAGLVTAVLVALTLVLLTRFFADLPQATLAAIVIAAVLPLLRTGQLRRLQQIDEVDFSLAAVCLFGVLLFGVLGGIVVAMMASLVALILRSYRPEVAVLGRARSLETDEDLGFRDVTRHRDVETYPGLVIFRFGQEIFFANASFFRDRVRALTEGGGPPVHVILVDAAAITHIDSTGLDMLRDLRRELDSVGVSLGLARLKGPVRDALARAGLVGEFGDAALHATVRAGVAAFLASEGAPR